MRYRLALFSLLITAGPTLAADEGGANPFAGTVYQSIAAIIVFLLLVAVLKKFAWGGILQGLQDRENKIKQDLQQAEIAANQAQATLSEYQAKLAAAQEDARRIIDQSRADAQKIAGQIKDQAQNEIDQLRQRAHNDIRIAKEQAVGDVYAQAADLATRVAERILKHEIKAEDHHQLIQDSIAELTPTS